MNRTKTIAFTLFCSLTFFSFGTAMMDYFLVYPSRAIVGADEFVAYHALLEQAIIPVSVLPFLLITLLNGFLLWKRPQEVSFTLLLVSFICLILDWLSTALIQIPMNLQLNDGKNSELIQTVMNTNWGRVVLETVQACTAFVMAHRNMKA